MTATATAINVHNHSTMLCLTAPVYVFVVRRRHFSLVRQVRLFAQVSHRLHRHAMNRDQHIRSLVKEYAGIVESEYPSAASDGQTHASAMQPSAGADAAIEQQQQQQHEQPPTPATATPEQLTVLQYQQRLRTYTGTGVALSLPPKKKYIYRPYSLDDHKPVKWPRTEKDVNAAQAILDLSASTPVVVRPVQQLPPPQPVLQQLQAQPDASQLQSHEQQPPSRAPAAADVEQRENLHPQRQRQRPAATTAATSKTVAYTHEAFFVSDGRSKRKSSAAAAAGGTASPGGPPSKYTCSERGKRYATSSNLLRHKQTHRSLDSQSAKRCNVCGAPYVSSPALAMHQLTHEQTHMCDVCYKVFSRPWLLKRLQRSHTRKKRYGCAHCGKLFADRSNLRVHMLAHSGDKNLACPRWFKSYLDKDLESVCRPA